MRAWRPLIAALSIAAALPTGARSEAIPALPPYTGAYQPQGVDERGLWMEVDEAERQLRDSKVVINDAKLNQYLRDVLCRTVGQTRCESARIYVVRSAVFNASMAPNGMLVVNTGLLLRVRDEAELAAVLGHEFAHFELRHSLLAFKHRRSATDIFAWAGVVAAGAAAYGGAAGYNTASSAQSVQIAAIGSTFAFSRDEERAADLTSMAYLRASPYDPRCFADIWDRVMNETDASARGRKQNSTRYERVSFFASHPTSLDRATYLRQSATAMAKPGEAYQDRYDAAMAGWRAQFLADQVKLNDFEGTDYLLGELAGSHWTPDLLLSRGDLYRTRGNPRDLISAIAFYRDAIAMAPDNAELYHGMGLAQMRSRDPAGGETLKKYLAMKPDAPDRAMISMLVQ